MKRDEYRLGVYILAALLLVIFASPISHIIDQPLLPRIESLFNSVLNSHGALSSTHFGKVPIREDLTRG